MGIKRVDMAINSIIRERLKVRPINTIIKECHDAWKTYVDRMDIYLKSGVSKQLQAERKKTTREEVG